MPMAACGRRGEFSRKSGQEPVANGNGTGTIPRHVGISRSRLRRRPAGSASLNVRLIGSNTDNPGGAHDSAIVRLEATVRSDVAYTE
jgi:hypothetical protein